jgi:putative membrane protein insertion efficiency factor
MKTLLIKLIRLYQTAISPRKIACCRFEPSCSQYAIEAITVHGVFKGGFLAVWRILRCNPFCKGGHDPVPLKGLKNPPEYRICGEEKTDTEQKIQEEGKE